MNFLAQKKIEQFLPRFEYFLEELQKEQTPATEKLHVLFSDMFADWVATEMYGQAVSLENQKRYKNDIIALLSANLHAPILSSNMETIFTAISYFAYTKSDMLEELSVCLAYNGMCSSLPVHFPQAEVYVQAFFEEAKNKETYLLDKIDVLADGAKEKHKAFLEDIQLLVEPITEKQQTLNQIEAVCKKNIEAYKEYVDEETKRRK